MSTNAAEVAELLQGGFRPEGLSYKQYTKLMKSAGQKPLPEFMFAKAEEKGGDDEPEAESDEDEDDDKKEEAPTEKSLKVSTNDLQKAIDAFETLNESLDPKIDREAYLRARLDQETITKSERRELGALLVGDDEDAEPIRKSLDERIDDDNPISGKTVKANDFLKSLTAALDLSLKSVETSAKRESAATREAMRGLGELTKSLASTVVQQSDMLDYLHERLATVEHTPVQRRAVQNAPLAKRNMSKSLHREEEHTETLSKAQVLEGLKTLLIKSQDDAQANQIVAAIAKFESTGQIAPQHLNAARLLAGN